MKNPTVARKTRPAKVRLHKSRNTTVTGVHYQDLRSILTMAFVHASDELRRMGTDAEGRKFYTAMQALIKEIEASANAEHRRVIIPSPAV